MRKFGCGVGAAFLFLASVALVWFSLSEQSQGIVVGILLGAAGVVLGILGALAVVCVLLLTRMSWQVQNRPSPPIVMGWPGYGHTPLPPPAETVDSQWGYPPGQPTWNRPGRGYRVLGGDDMPEGQ